MTATTARIRHSAVAVPMVWDRLWEHALSDERDDALLARERCTSRWAMIGDRLTGTFGGMQGLRTVELGSGRGDLSALLAQAGSQVTLLDTSERALNQAHKRFNRLGLPANFERGDLFAPPKHLAGSFDVALSSGVIEHFEGEVRTKAIQAHADVLDQRGVCIISVPNAWCPTYRLWKLYLELRGWWPYGPERPYSHNELIRRGRAAGFSRIEVEGAGFWQSVGDHFCRGLLGRGPDWAARRSLLDRRMGLSLVMFGWRDR